MSHNDVTQKRGAMTDETLARSALIHVRVKPALRELIETEAKRRGVTPSAVIRRILATYYESQTKGRP